VLKFLKKSEQKNKNRQKGRMKKNNKIDAARTEKGCVLLFFAVA